MDLEEAQESSRGVRKAPASDAMDEGPNAKRQMASLPFDSTMVPMDVSPNQSVPIPSADDVLVDVSSYCVGSWRREKRNIRRIDDRHDHRFSHCICPIFQMIRRSGAKTPAEVAEFCRVTGIPVSVNYETGGVTFCLLKLTLLFSCQECSNWT